VRISKTDAIREFIFSGEYYAPPGTVAFERELRGWCDDMGYTVQGFGRNIRDSDAATAARYTMQSILEDEQLREINQREGWFDDPDYDDLLSGPYNPLKAIKYDFTRAFGLGRKNRRGR